LVYVPDGNGGVSAYQCIDAGTIPPTLGDPVFTLTADVDTSGDYTGTYSVDIVGQMDGQKYTDDNAFDSPVTTTGGHASDAYVFEISDGVYVVTTATANGGSEAINFAANKMGVHNTAIDDGTADETLIFNFSEDILNDSLYYLTTAEITLGAFESGDEASWEAYNNGLLVSSDSYTGIEGKVNVSSGVSSITTLLTQVQIDEGWSINGTVVSYSGLVDSTITLNYDIGVVGQSGDITLSSGESVDLNQFDEIQFSAEEGSYNVTGIYATNPIDFPGVDHTINVDFTATDGDADFVSDSFQVTFDDGDNVIEGTAYDEVINYITDVGVDGGAGTDTVIVSGGTLDLSNVSDIEIIQLDVGATVTGSTSGINPDDVWNATDGTNTLIIESDVSGSAVIVDTDLGSFEYNGIIDGYHNYSGSVGSDSIILQIEDVIDVD